MSALLRIAAGVAAVLFSAAVVAGGGPAPTHARAATLAPNPPSATEVYAGVDGVVVTWQVPRGGSDPAGYEIQRGEAVGGPFTAIAAVGADTLRWQDLTALSGRDYTYRVLATAGDVKSSGGPRRTTRLPAYTVAPGPRTVFEIKGQRGSPWAKGLIFTDAQVSVTRLTDTTYSVRGVSDAASPQGAQEVAFTIGSTSDGGRLSAGTNVSTVGPEAVQAKLPALFPTTAGSCGADRSGKLAMGRSSFAADGTPLSLYATFSYCGATGRVAWKHEDGFERVVPAESRVVLDSGQTADVEFRNTGDLGIRPQRAQIDNFTYGTPSPGWSIVKDQCDNQQLNPGTSCVVTVARDASTSVQQAHLLLTTKGFNQPGNPEVILAAGPDLPPPPLITGAAVASTLDGIAVEWLDRPADPPVTGWTIYRQKYSGAELEKLAEVGPEVNRRWIDRGAASSATYTVAARNAVGEGPRAGTNSGTPVSPSDQVAVTAMWSTGTDRDLAVLPYGTTLPLRLTADGGDHADPFMERGSRKLAYAATTDSAGPEDYDLWVRTNFTDPARRLTQDPSSADRRPAISPDGSTVAFARYVDGIPSIWTVPFDGGAAVQIPGTEGDADPAWAPNGNVLAVSHATDPGSRIDIVNLSGSYRRILVDIPGKPAIRPSWPSSTDEPTVRYVRVGDVNRHVQVHALTGEQNADSSPVNASDGASDFDERLLSSYGSTGYTKPTYVRPVKAVASTIEAGGAELSWQQGKIRPANPACFECGHWTIVRRSEANGPAPDTIRDGVGVYDGPATATPVTGLQTGAVYRFTLFAFNKIGDMTTMPTVWGAVPAVAPVVAPKGSALTALVGDGPSFTMSWGKAPPATSTYQVEVGTQTLDAAKGSYSPDIAWKPFSSGIATSKVFAPAPGTVYFARVRVVDEWGAATPWGPVSTIVVPYDDRTFTASKGFGALTGQKGRFAGTARQSSAIGDTLTGTFYASSLGLIADVCPTCGKVGIYVDGKLVKTVDTYAKSAASRRTVWSMSFPTVGKHVVKLVTVSSPKRQTVRVDAFLAGR